MRGPVRRSFCDGLDGGVAVPARPAPLPGPAPLGLGQEGVQAQAQHRQARLLELILASAGPLRYATLLSSPEADRQAVRPPHLSSHSPARGAT
jgi:hypothetical protein